MQGLKLRVWIIDCPQRDEFMLMGWLRGFQIRPHFDTPLSLQPVSIIKHWFRDIVSLFPPFHVLETMHFMQFGS